MVLARMRQGLVEMAIRKRAGIAVIPVSFETLTNRQTAMEYFECLRQIPSDLRNCIMPMLCHCPMGVPEGRLAELVNPLKRLTRAVSMRLESRKQPLTRSEEHTSELQSLMRISYAVFCLKKKKTRHRD